MFNRLKKLFRKETRKPYLLNNGYCVICEHEALFESADDWLRDSYKCNICQSIPRQRAIIQVLHQVRKDWPFMKIHESSPGGVSSDYLLKTGKDYSSSQFLEGTERGAITDGVQCQDLTALTFDDDTFDIFITQDVFEHVLEPDKAFGEIARVLKQGGIHIFTIPWYPELANTRIRASINGTEIVYHEPKIFHGNPVSNDGSLVTRDWGLDFPSFIHQHSGMFTSIHQIRDRHLGIDGKYLEVFVSWKD